jgi:hypothetical protein
MGIGWVHRPRPAPHLHGCMKPGAAHGENGSTWVCLICEMLWILSPGAPWLPTWKHWKLATWWQRWKYWNWGEGKAT